VNEKRKTTTFVMPEAERTTETPPEARTGENRQNPISKENRRNPTARGWKNRGNTIRIIKAQKIAEIRSAKRGNM